MSNVSFGQGIDIKVDYSYLPQEIQDMLKRHNEEFIEKYPELVGKPMTMYEMFNPESRPEIKARRLREARKVIKRINKKK